MKKISLFDRVDVREGFHHDETSSKGAYKPTSKPNPNVTQEVPKFDPDITQNVTIGSPESKPTAPSAPRQSLKASNQADAFIKAQTPKTPKADVFAKANQEVDKMTAGVHRDKTSVNARMKGAGVPQPKSDYKAPAKPEEPRKSLSAAKGIPDAIKQIDAHLAANAPKLPKSQTAPPSLSNQNVRPRKKIGEGSLINTFRGTANKVMGRKNVPIERTSPSPVDPNNLETPKIWRNNSATDKPKVSEPAPVPAPAPSAPTPKSDPIASNEPQGPKSDPVASQAPKKDTDTTPGPTPAAELGGGGNPLKKERQATPRGKKVVGEPAEPAPPPAPPPQPKSQKADAPAATSSAPDKKKSNTDLDKSVKANDMAHAKLGKAKARAGHRLSHAVSKLNPTDTLVKTGFAVGGKISSFINQAAHIKKY